MIYIISFIEAFCNGLLSINTVLYLKFILKFTEVQTATFLSLYGILSSILILSLGWVIDRIGPKKAMLIGSAFLIISRLALSALSSIPLVYLAFFGVVLGSAIKSSSVLVYIRQTNKSFSIDYIVFNLAYFLSGILYDHIEDYQLVYFISGFINIINIGFIFWLPSIERITKTVHKIHLKTVKTVLLYNIVMMPVSFIFTFMATILPKWVLQVLGKNAPVGEIYGSLNPAIVLLMVPLYSFYIKKYIKNSYLSVIIGTVISSLSLMLILLPFNSYWYPVLISIAVFTIGEAIWSPNNMEVSTKLCPEGSEGKYLTLSLIPRTLGNLFMGWFSAF